MSFLQRLRSMGPGILIAAAFIGPGTITTCTLAGARFGYALLWGLLFSVFATIVLQEMTARLGIVSRMGLGEALNKQFTSKLSRALAIFLVLSAIVIGNAAYETGNILGATLGVEHTSKITSINTLWGEIRPWGIVIGLLAFVVLITGSYKALEKILTGLVVLMGVSFLSTAIMIGPELLPMLKGLVIPTIPKGGLLILVGLIGTTVVPYNLFLHASIVQEKWKSADALKTARIDLILSMILGGIISVSVVVSSAAAFFGPGTEIKGASGLAVQLEPLLGSWAGISMSLGLFAAGITSAITAPLAAAYATAGMLNWKVNLKSWKFRTVWMIILFVGVLFSTIGFKPIQAIVFAQITNGILLPVIAIYLLVIMNSRRVLGEHTNKIFQNILSFIVVLVMVLLGTRSILLATGIIT